MFFCQAFIPNKAYTFLNIYSVNTTIVGDSDLKHKIIHKFFAKDIFFPIRAGFAFFVF